MDRLKTLAIWLWNFVNGQAYASRRAPELTGAPQAPEAQPIDGWHAPMEPQRHPDDVARRRAAIAAHIDGVAPAYEAECRIRTPQGRYRWLRVRGKCVRDDAGRALRMAGSSGDIDARKRAEEALRVS